MTGGSKKSETLSLRVTAKQADRIRIAATAAHLSVTEYLYRRVTDRPIISTPRLAALAELVSALRRLEAKERVDPALITELQQHVVRLAQTPFGLDELA